MLKVWWPPYRWLCLIGLHEYTVSMLPTRRGRKLRFEEYYTCEVCGKRKRRHDAEDPQ